MIIGSHVHFGVDQLYGSVKEALSYGANALMLYTGAPQNTVRSNINDELIVKAKELMNENNISMDNVICHAPYIINLANKERKDSWMFSISFLRQEISRIEQMGIKYIVVHPGNFLKQSKEDAIKNISEAINQVMEGFNDSMFLIETMAGKGTECGSNTEEVKQILDGVKEKDKVGVCIDTCHLNDSGINIADFDEYLKDFDKKIGINKIKCIHVNDSKNPIGARKDRHENIGLGTIGFDNLINVCYNELLKDVPKILETPWIGEYPPYKQEIEMIRTKTFNPNLAEDVTKGN